MTKIMKSKSSSSNRVKLFRGVQSIMKQDEASHVNPIELKKKLLRTESISNDEDNNQYQSPNLSNELRSWAIQFNVRQTAVSALLKILLSFGIASLPKDSRALLKTPRTVQIENISQ